MTTREPKDIPIIFSTPMVRAQLKSIKTKTRRLLYSEREAHMGRAMNQRVMTIERGGRQIICQPFDGDITTKPIGTYWDIGTWHTVQPGDRLWVRENVKLVSQGPGTNVGIAYQADGDSAHVEFFDLPGHKLKRAGITPCIHMPKKLSRITWLVEDVKIERLSELTEKDALREGIIEQDGGFHWLDIPRAHRDLLYPTARQAFFGLWDHLHGDGPGKNPWLVAIGAKVIFANIDSDEAKQAA